MGSPTRKDSTLKAGAVALFPGALPVYGAYRGAKWADGRFNNSGVQKMLAGPDAPAPKAAPPPADTTAAIMRALNRDATDRAMRRSKGRTAAFSLSNGPTPGEPYRAAGSKSLLGG